MEKPCNSSNILVNNETKSIPLDTSILKLLEILHLNKDRVVIELNKEIIQKDKFNTIYLKDNDKLEIVTFVGGG